MPGLRVCIFLREHIGDVVNSTGAIWSIRQNLPHAHITVSVGERAASALENSPEIESVILRPKARDILSKLGYLNQLRKGHFGAAIILDEARSQLRNARSARIRLCLGVGDDNPKFDANVKFDEDSHDSRDQYTNLLSLLEFDPNSEKPRLHPSDEDYRKVACYLSGQTVLVHPGASEPTRRWLPERFGDVVKWLSDHGMNVWITGSAEERELCERVAGTYRDRILAGKLSILEFAALAEKSVAVVVGDTGPMHIAAAMGTRVIVPYGPTLPHLTGPYGEGHHILQGPCSCVLKDWSTCSYECMNNIGVDRVLNALNTVLEL